MIFPIRANSSGSCFFIQSSLGAVKPANAMFPVRALSTGRPTVSFSQAVSSAVRPSFHKMAGRSTASVSSSATRPCIWPPTPMPRTSRASKPANSSGTPSRHAVHQSPGSCSLQPGCGKQSGYSLETVFRTQPFSSTRRSLQAEVPRSIPIYSIDTPPVVSFSIPLRRPALFDDSAF